MGSFSIWHLLIVGLIVLLVFGPSKLPGLGKGLGEAIKGFKDGLNGNGDIDVTNSARREQISNNPQGQPGQQNTHSQQTTQNTNQGSGSGSQQS